MKIIGLTGGIGSGKSTVLNMFQELGMEIYVADIEAKKLMNTDKELIQLITKLFGEQAYLDNKLNRNYISQIVFNNKEKLNALNAFVHPKVRLHFNEFLKNCKSDFIVYEAAVLFESGSSNFCDFIITVIADLEDKIQRVISRDKVSEEEVLNRMKNQFNDEFKIRNASFVIRNKDLVNTKEQVSTIYNLIVKSCN